MAAYGGATLTAFKAKLEAKIATAPRAGAGATWTDFSGVVYYDTVNDIVLMSNEYDVLPMTGGSPAQDEYDHVNVDYDDTQPGGSKLINHDYSSYPF